MRLLEPGAEPPPLERLPPDAVFFDPVRRNIYRALHALYDQAGCAPAARSVVAALGDDAAAVARVAQYQNALEYPANCRRLGLGECVERLVRRWRKERLRSLVHEIRDAQRSGDQGRLERLMDEKEKLSYAHHRVIPDGSGASSRG